LFIYYYRTEKHLLAEVFFVGDNVDATKPLSLETRADWNIKKTMYKYAYAIKYIDKHLCHSGKSILYLSKKEKRTLQQSLY